MPRAEDWRYEVIFGEVRLSYRPRPLFFSRATDLAVTARRSGTLDVRPVEPTDRAACVGSGFLTKAGRRAWHG